MPDTFEGHIGSKAHSRVCLLRDANWHRGLTWQSASHFRFAFTSQPSNRYRLKTSPVFKRVLLNAIKRLFVGTDLDLTNSSCLNTPMQKPIPSSPISLGTPN